MYTLHPSSELVELFRSAPFQGVPPEAASFLFVGLDANYVPQIADLPVFKEVLAYHADGVKFWQQNKVHHPFLLPGYVGDGRFYHRSFAEIGFSPEHAELVSFMELLHVPTVGRSQLSADDLLLSHLERLNAAILEGSARHIFIPSGVARLMRSVGVFGWLPSRPVARLGPLGVLRQDGDRTVYSHLHFSVYGKFQEQKVAEAKEIRRLLSQVTGV